MPAYSYQCTHCQATERRIGGVDDHLAMCTHCGHLMVRLDYDLFAPYFEASADTEAPRPSRFLGQVSATTIVDKNFPLSYSLDEAGNEARLSDPKQVESKATKALAARR